MTKPTFQRERLGFPWPTRDPFLFCVHHLDHYPAGNARLGVAPDGLRGRQLGMDFELKDGFRMYHGEEVPGFPAHPHRGFETVTLARKGFIDHSDSLGATARFGQGDVQWMTAGKGIVHCEMFPLLDPEAGNTGELFQIWMNLPAKDKMVDPHFSMLWSESIPRVELEGGKVELTVMAGGLELSDPAVSGSVSAPPPPPASWAARPEADVAIWTMKLAPKATFTLPAVREGTHRALYFFRGASCTVAGAAIEEPSALFFDEAGSVRVDNGPAEAELLLLQGRPIGEPVARHGPFVMNTPDELRQAYRDYQHTQFGGWPWASADPVHPREEGRFAQHPDGRVDRPLRG